MSAVDYETHPGWEGLVEQTETHDSTFTHGFTLGYVWAKIEGRVSFRRWVLANQLVIIERLLRGTGAKIALKGAQRSGYQVDFAEIEVTFP